VFVSVCLVSHLAAVEFGLAASVANLADLLLQDQHQGLLKESHTHAGIEGSS